MKVLHLEDNAYDAELICELLRDAALECQITVASTRKQYLEQIARSPWDLILADYAIPGFDGIAALKIAVDRYPGIPFIFVSGVLGEDVAVEALKNGASDYVVKNRLSRLPKVVQRALREAELEQEQKRTEQRRQDLLAAQESERLFRTHADSIPQLAWMANPDGFAFWYNRRWYDYTGTTPQQMEGWGWQSVHDPKYLPAVLSLWLNSISTGDPFEMEFPLRHRDGEFRWFLTRGLPLKDSQGNLIRWFGTSTDVTDIRQARDILREREAEARKLNDELEFRVQERTAQLRESEDRYRTLLDNVRDYAIFMLDEQGCISSWNNSAQRIKQYSADEIAGKHFSCFYLPEDVQAGLPDELLRLARLHGHIEHQGWRVRKDGSRFWGLVMITALHDAAGMVRGFTQITRDNSERKYAGDQLQAQTNSLKQQAALLDLAHDAIIVREVSDGLRILFWNAGAVEMYGYAKDQALGQNIRELLKTTFPKPLESIHEELFEVGTWEGELVQVTEGGVSLITASRWALQRDEYGLPASVLVINRDVTKQRNAELALRESAERLRLATRAGSVGIWDINITTGVMIWDDQMFRLYGTTRADFRLSLESWEARLHPEDRERTLREIELATLGEIPYDTEFRVIWDDGSIHYIRALANVMRDSTSRPTRGIGTSWDITDKKTLENELRVAMAKTEQANLAKGQFLAAMSHEIRTPMNSILGMADLLAETKLNSIQREYVSRFQKAGSHLLMLINEILDLSKVESGHFELECISFSVAELVRDTVELMTPRARSQNIDLQSVVNLTGVDDAKGDPNRLKQVLQNLLSNAIKFTQAGRVVLTVDQHPDQRPGHLQFSVEDTGIGIPADKLNAIFEDFTQADSSTTRRFGGTGLGLGICRRLVEKMGGAISVRSVLGEGSTFFFDIFLQVSESRTSAATTLNGARAKGPLAVLAPPSENYALKILIAEDSDDNRFLMDVYLKGTPCHLTFVENGVAAVEAFKRNQFDLVLMDVQMPVMDGLTATAEIRAWELQYARSPTPIIALTANALQDDLEKSKVAGCNGHVTKPISKQRLLAAIESFQSAPINSQIA